MRQFLFIFLTLTGTVYGQQPSTSDTLCFDLPTVRKLVTNSEQGKILKQQVVILNDRIGVLQSQIDKLESKDEETVKGYEAEIKLLKDEIALHKGQVADMEKIIKRMKRNAFWSKISGGLTTAAALTLFIIKK